MATPEKGEFATSAKTTVASFIGGLLANKDAVLASKGGDLSIYRDVHRDPQVKATFQQRRSAVISAEYEVEPASESARDKEIAEFIQAQLKRIEFDLVTDKMLFAIFYGYAVAEVIWGVDGGRVVIDRIKVRDQVKYRFSQDGGLYLMTMTNPQGERVPDRKFWTVSTGAENDDQPYGLGLAHYLYWPVFFKKNALKFWLIYLEKFGMPTSTAKVSQATIQDPKLKKQALETLEAIQVDSGVLIPDGMEIAFLEAARSGSADYPAMQKEMNEAISKVVLSQTMTTDNGSSRSQSETHQDVKDDVVKSDADLICDSFNKTVVRWLVDFNYGENVPAPRVWRKTDPEEDELQRVERDKGIYSLGFEPSEDYILETYGPGWTKKAPLQGGFPGEDEVPGFPSFTEAGRLAMLKRNHRADQQAIAVAAQRYANQFEEVVGERVGQLIELAETTGDFEQFRKGLNQLLEQGPTEQSLTKIENSGFFARLAGFVKGKL